MIPFVPSLVLGGLTYYVVEKDVALAGSSVTVSELGMIEMRFSVQNAMIRNKRSCLQPIGHFIDLAVESVIM